MALMHHQRDCSGHPVITTQVGIEGGERQTEDGKSFRASWHTSTGRYGNVVVLVLCPLTGPSVRKHWEKNLIISVRVLAFLLVVNSDLAAFFGGFGQISRIRNCVPKTKAWTTAVFWLWATHLFLTEIRFPTRENICTTNHTCTIVWEPYFCFKRLKCNITITITIMIIIIIIMSFKMPNHKEKNKLKTIYYLGMWTMF